MATKLVAPAPAPTPAPAPVFLGMDDSIAVGVDVGGTKIAGGVVELSTGTVLERAVVPTHPERGGGPVLEDSAAVAATLLDRAIAAGWRVAGIGVCVAELVDLEGNVTSGHTIAWKGVEVRRRFAELAPAIVESDVRAGALAEARFGAGRGLDWFAFLSVGTGISSALVFHGEPLPGARGNALVIGTGARPTTRPACGARTDPVLEEVASGPALLDRYNARAGGFGAGSAEEVAVAAAANDPHAVEVITQAGRALGSSVGFLVNVTDPHSVVVGGGLGLAGGLYWETFVDSLREHVWAEGTRDLPVVPAYLGPDAAMIGAAVFAGRNPHHSRRDV